MFMKKANQEVSLYKFITYLLIFQNKILISLEHLSTYDILQYIFEQYPPICVFFLLKK